MRILITGGAGMLARALLRHLSDRGHEVVALDRRALDVTDAAAVGQTVAAFRPEVAIQGAAYANVDGAEAREAYAREINAVATRTLAHACSIVGARLVYPSTDYVFDGSARRPYRPEDVARPINAYGRSKLLGERAAAAAGDWLVVRTAWLYGPEKPGFVRGIVQRAQRIAEGASDVLRVTDDQVSMPTWTRNAADLFATLIESGAPPGIYHATDGGGANRVELAQEALRLSGLGHVPITVASRAEFGGAAARPRYSALDLEKTEAVLRRPIPHWRDALAEAVRAGAF